MLHADLVLCKCWCCCWCNEGWDHWWESASEGSEECAGEDKEGETDGCLLAFSENKSVDYRWRLANVCVFVLFSRSKWHQPVTPALRVWDFNQCSVSLGYGKSVLRVGRVETTSIVSDFPPLEVGNFSPTYKLGVIMHGCWHGKAPHYRVNCHRCCWQAASQVGYTANDSGATTLAIHCWPPSIYCARPHSLELFVRRPRTQQDYEAFRFRFSKV